jgi:hypothetical protein
MHHLVSCFAKIEAYEDRMMLVVMMIIEKGSIVSAKGCSHSDPRSCFMSAGAIGAAGEASGVLQSGQQGVAVLHAPARQLARQLRRHHHERRHGPVARGGDGDDDDDDDEEEEEEEDDDDDDDARINVFGVDDAGGDDVDHMVCFAPWQLERLSMAASGEGGFDSLNDFAALFSVFGKVRARVP